MRRYAFATLIFCVAMILCACINMGSTAGSEQKCEIHKDLDMDSICDECGCFIKHEHTYSDEFVYNDKKHYRPSNCCEEAEKQGYVADYGSHKFGEETVTLEPTCTTPGEKSKSCYVCGYTVKSSIPARYHTVDGYAFDDMYHWEIWTCGCEIIKWEHTWSEGEIIKAPTCTEEGEMHYRCTSYGCDAEKTEPIPIVEHAVETVYSSDKTHHWFSYTCGCEELEQREEHSFSDPYVTKLPTCTELGVSTAYCTVCGAKEYTDIDMIDHTYDKEMYEYDDEKHWNPPSCGCEGLRGSEADHNYNDKNICSVCGYQRVATDGFVYILSEDYTSYYLFGVSDKELENAVVPAMSLDKPVTKILAGAFSGMSFNCISLPYTVTVVEDGAFDNCTFGSITVDPDNAYYMSRGGCLIKRSEMLLVRASDSENTYIDDQVTEIMSLAFADCGKIESLVIPAAVRVIGQYAFRGTSPTISFAEGTLISEIASYTFSGCKGGTIDLPTEIVTIRENAFADCGATPILKEGIKTIECRAFVNCIGITDLYLPDSLEFIGEGAFSGCSSIISVNMPFVGSSRIAVEKQALFGYIFGDWQYEGGTSIRQAYSSQGSNTCYAPDRLEKITVRGGDIKYGAFSNFKSLKEVVILSDVYQIGENAFYGCSAVESITIPYIGKSLMVANETEESVFGYIFGSVYSGGANQCYKYMSYVRYNVPDSLKRIIMTGGNLRHGAFSGCLNVEEIILPDGVTSIFDYSFDRCESLAELIIPDSVSSIGKRSFYNCKSLDSINIPASVSEIGESAFSDSRITKVYANDISAWCNIAFVNIYSNPIYQTGASLYLNGELISGDIVIPEGITEIRDAAFYHCTGIASVTIPECVTVIGKYAFAKCSGLGEIVGGDGLITIRVGAFQESGIRSFAPSETLSDIENEAFSYCHALMTVSLPSKVLHLGTRAFYDCIRLIILENRTQLDEDDLTMSNITDYPKIICTDASQYEFVEIDGGFVFVTIGDKHYLIDYHGNATDVVLPEKFNGADYYMGNAVFKSAVIESIDTNGAVLSLGMNAFEDSSIKKAVLTGVVTVDSGAFRGCRSLTEIVLDKDTLKIYASAFAYCTSLEAISLPGKICEIEGLAFYGCSSLATVTGGKSVTSLGGGAFGECTSLTEISFDTVSFLGVACFEGCSSLVAVNMPKLKVISERAFASASALVGINTSAPSITTVGVRAFDGCELLERVPLSNAFVGDFAFSGCIKLNLLPENTLATVGKSAFEGCTSLTCVYFTDNYSTDISIGEYAFSGTGITDLSISSMVTSIGTGAFMNCTRITSIVYNARANGFAADNLIFADAGTLSTGITLISDKAGAIIPANMFCPSTSETDPMTPYLVYMDIGAAYQIGENAFKNAIHLKSLSVPNVSEIAPYAFYNCKSVTFMKYYATNLETIGTYAFRDVGKTFGAVDLLIASNVESIPEYLFYNGGGTAVPLSSLSFEAKSALKTIGSYAFYEQKSMKGIVDFPNSLNMIDYYAFCYCTEVDRFLVPTSVTTVGAYAFSRVSAEIYCAPSSRPLNWSSMWIYDSSAKVYWGRVG